MGQVIAVLSGKGGTGKTTVCAGVALALAQDGKQVLVIDCDAGLRNLDIALGVSEMDALSFADVSGGSYGLDMAAVHPENEHLHFLTAPANGTWQDVEEKAFEKLIAKAKKKFAYVLLDGQSGIGQSFSLLARCADRCLLVTDGTPAAVRNTARAGQELEKLGKTDVRLIVNRVDARLFSKRKLTVDDIMDETGVPLLGVICEDVQVLLGAKRPGISKKSAAAACGRIAKRLQGISEPITV